MTLLIVVHVAIIIIIEAHEIRLDRLVIPSLTQNQLEIKFFFMFQICWHANYGACEEHVEVELNGRNGFRPIL